jgi:hypothetical protein
MTDTINQVREALEKAMNLANEMTGRAHLQDLLGTKEWDFVAGGSHLWAVSDQARAALAALSHPAPDVPGAEEVEAIRTWVASNEKRFKTWHHDVGDGEVAFDFCVTLLAELDAAKSRIDDYRFALRVLSDGNTVDDAGAAWARSIARGVLND